MARFTGAKGKIVRRFGENIFETPKFTRLLERRENPPGQHGGNQRRKKMSDYGLQLQEKQKLKYAYGLLEKQFRRTFKKAQRQKGATGANLLVLLESRLDNAVFRAGFSGSREQARQLINHGHLLVNGQRVDIPSYQVRAGDLISVSQRERSRALLVRCVEENQRFVQTPWLEVEREKLTFRVQHLPERDEITAIANEQLVVELYSK